MEDPGPMLKLLAFFDFLGDMGKVFSVAEGTRPSAIFSLFPSAAMSNWETGVSLYRGCSEVRAVIVDCLEVFVYILAALAGFMCIVPRHQLLPEAPHPKVRHLTEKN